MEWDSQPKSTRWNHLHSHVHKLLHRKMTRLPLLTLSLSPLLFTIYNLYKSFTYHLSISYHLSITPTLTQQWKQDGVVVWHQEKVYTAQGTAGLQVTKRVSHVTIFSTAIDENLPTGVGLPPLEDVLSEGWGLQFILIEGEVPDDHGLTGGTVKLHHRVCWARWLHRKKFLKFHIIHMYMYLSFKKISGVKIYFKTKFHVSTSFY